MGVTLSTAAERRRRQAAPSHRPGVPSLSPGSARGREAALLLGGLAVIVFGLVLVYQAVTHVPAAASGAKPGTVLNLNTLSRPEEILPLLDSFEDASERLFAARAIQRHLKDRPAPNVGELGRIRIPEAEIATGGKLPVLTERLAERRARTAEGEAVTVPLLSASQVRQLKPDLAVRTASEFRSSFLFWTGLFMAGLLALHFAWRVRRFAGDELLLPIVAVLAGIGLLVMVAIRDPLRDLLLFRTFVQGVLGGCALAFAGSLLDAERSPLRRRSVLPLGAAFLLSAVLIAFGSGPGGSDVKVNLLGFQPVEAIKILIVLFLAGYFFDRWEFLRELQEKRLAIPGAPAWLRLPKLEYLLPPFAAIGGILFFFFLQKDLGPALVLAFLFFALYCVARGRLTMAFLGTAVVVGAFFVGYKIGYPRTVTGRIQMWLSPWDNAFRGGEHLAHSLWAMAGGALSGTGLGLGQPGRVPEVHTDMVLAAVGEELGFLGLLAVFALYGLLVYRGFRAALKASGLYSFFLATGLTLLLAFQIVLIAGGVTGLFPLSGVVSPFLSSGRTAMFANFLIVGLLLAVSARPGDGEATRKFRGPLRWVGLSLALALGAIVLRAAWFQVVKPDEILTRGVLALQGDGSRRFLYNPRLAEIAASIPRGSIVDRNGLPLASSNPAELMARRAAYQKLGVSLDQELPDRPERTTRHYPLGGVTFHLLGDLRNRVNWGAPNTTYAEREARIRLQGYDDYAAVVEVVQPDGRTSREIKLDYSELIPLLRHRWQPEHPEVRRILERDRTVHLAVDARLQLRAADILERYAREAGHGAAAVVLDADTGETLAAVSYPWPSRLPIEADTDGEDDPGIFDRARYGIYPPGSTFKLVTAMAALRKDPAIAEKDFECVGLPDGRVGNRVRGWGKAIRDDPTVHVPHGSVNLERGISQSCNAYFAQLGTYEVGPERLMETADVMGISVAVPKTAEQLKDALPQASYGQGQVTATPLQMARVAATLAQGGEMPQVRWATDGSDGRTPGKTPVLARGPAAIIARAMRGVVTVGTASRFLGGIVPAMAGKTGTAEVAGKKSHSWFVGFAPYGQGGARRIAVSVIVEHGGYGGRLAAPAAGEIVKAAAELGLIR